MNISNTLHCKARLLITDASTLQGFVRGRKMSHGTRQVTEYEINKYIHRRSFF